METVVTRENILDQILPLVNPQAIRNSTQVDTAAVPADFAADTACTMLVWDGCLGQEGEFYAAALAASIKCPGCVR